MKRIYLAIPLLLLPTFLFAQEVQNTSYTTSTGDKVLRLEFTIPLNRQEAWKLLTTAEGWKKWAAPVVSVDLKVGGLILTNYDKNKTVGDSGTIRLPILSYLEEEMIILKVILNDSFTAKVRQEDGNLQEVIQLVDTGEGKTRVISSMIGWGKDP